jgi:hypothetical protein
MWSIILPIIATVVITGITAYCIYQQNKHYLKINLACKIIDTSKDIIKQFIPSQSVNVNYITAFQEERNSFTLLASETLFIPEQLKTLDFEDCCKKMDDYVKSEKLDTYEGYNPEEHNYLKTALSFLRTQKSDLVMICMDGMGEKDKTKIDLLNKRFADVVGETHKVTMFISAYLSKLEILIVKEKISFIKPISQSIQKTLNKIKGYKNKLLLFYCRYKNKFLDWLNKIKKMSDKITK